jgi:hypothetical protein
MWENLIVLILSIAQNPDANCDNCLIQLSHIISSWKFFLKESQNKNKN